MRESINMNDMIDYVMKNTELNTKSRIREKFIEIFDMLDIDRNLLKGECLDTDEKTDTTEYMFPKESMEFLNWLVNSFSDADVKEMRKGNFHNANTCTMRKMLAGFEEMFQKMELPESVIRQQVMRMYSRTRLPFWEKREKIFDILKSMREDLEVEKIGDGESKEINVKAHGFEEALKEYRNRRFRFFAPFDMVNVNDQLVFMDMIYEDYQKLQKRHREIYQILSEIRTEEINDSALEKVYEMSPQEEAELLWKISCEMAVQNELNKNPRYNVLLNEQEKIFAKNDFVKKLQPQYKKICDELKQIYEETQIRMYGEVILHDDIEDHNSTSRKTGKQALDEAIEYFEEQEKNHKEHLERLAKITPEERESTRNAINSILAERGMPLIRDKE